MPRKRLDVALVRETPKFACHIVCNQKHFLFKISINSIAHTFLIGIHSMQNWTATKRHGVAKERSTKRFEHTGNLFRKNQQLKVVSATFVLVCFLSLNESTCQTRKNVFYFTSKALFVLEKIKFSNFTFSNFITSNA